MESFRGIFSQKRVLILYLALYTDICHWLIGPFRCTGKPKYVQHGRNYELDLFEKSQESRRGHVPEWRHFKESRENCFAEEKIMEKRI